MTKEQYLEELIKYTRRVEYIMEDFDMGLMSANEAQQMIRDNHNEREGFIKAAKMFGIIN